MDRGEEALLEIIVLVKLVKRLHSYTLSESFFSNLDGKLRRVTEHRWITVVNWIIVIF